MAFSFNLFCFLFGAWGNPKVSPPRGLTLTASPPHVPEGHEICRWPLGRGGAGAPETRWRDVASETWRSYRFFSEGLIRTTDATSQRLGERGGMYILYVLMVKKCQICRIFWRDLVSGEIMKLTRWLSASAHFTVVLFVDTPFSFLLRPLPTGRMQKRVKTMALCRVKGACCMRFFFASGDQHVLCVKTRCNYSKWRAMMIPARD